jgi:membrane protein DedA with SNARE-associated domain
MERLGQVLKVALPLGLAMHLHLHHQFHGPAIGYVGLALGAFASWVGVPGPGEPLLIAAGLLAAKDKLDITGVLVVAFVAATVGGIIGWLIGLKAGRRVLTTRGPLRKARQYALARGDEVFARYPALAIFLTPSWVAGIHRVGTGLYLFWNAFGAAVWAVGIGLGAYYIGPAVEDLVADAGWVTGSLLVLLVIAGIAVEVVRRRRARRRSTVGPG